MSVARIKRDFRALPETDKLKLIRDLWDEVESLDAAAIVTPEQEAELDARYARYKRNPSDAIRLEEFKAAREEFKK